MQDLYKVQIQSRKHVLDPAGQHEPDHTDQESTFPDDLDNLVGIDHTNHLAEVRKVYTEFRDSTHPG